MPAAFPTLACRILGAIHIGDLVLLRLRTFLLCPLLDVTGIRITPEATQQVPDTRPRLLLNACDAPQLLAILRQRSVHPGVTNQQQVRTLLLGGQVRCRRQKLGDVPRHPNINLLCHYATASSAAGSVSNKVGMFISRSADSQYFTPSRK